jgi:NADH:ubiquinone oxidoreductase subunit 3 (subunit A)
VRENLIGISWGVRFPTSFAVFRAGLLVFDVEAVMLIRGRWHSEHGDDRFVAGIIFIGMLALGLADVWRKGDLEWVREEDREHARPEPPSLRRRKPPDN